MNGGVMNGGVMMNLDSQWTPRLMDCEGQGRTQAPLVAVTFPFVDQIGEVGTEVGFYEWSTTGLSLLARVDVGFRPDDVMILEDGLWAVVLGAEGELTTLDLSASPPQIQNQLSLPSASYKGFQLYPQSTRLFYATAFNSTEDSGLFVFEVGCEGEFILYENEDALALRLTFGAQPVKQSPDWVMVFGGQAVFDPIDPLDLRVYRFIPQNEGGQGWESNAAFDVWTDFIDAEGVGVSSDGRDVVMVNASPFSDEGNQIRIAHLNPPQEQNQSWTLESVQILENIRDPQRAVFDPGFDRVWVSQAEAGALFYLERSTVGTWQEGQRFTQLGLADHFVFSDRWDQFQGRINKQESWVWLPITQPSGGSYLARFISEENQVRALEPFELGSGAESLPDALDIWPKKE